MSKPNLQIQIYRRSQKENFKLKMLIISKKKGVNPRPAIKRGETPHHNNKITEINKSSLITFNINGLNRNKTSGTLSGLLIPQNYKKYILFFSYPIYGFGCSYRLELIQNTELKRCNC